VETYVLFFIASIVAGLINALAGGGGLITRSGRIGALLLEVVRPDCDPPGWRVDRDLDTVVKFLLARISRQNLS
jgi:hypothetical protein